MARTLLEAQNDRLKSYYRLTCKYCGEQIVVCQDDLDNFYGIPPHDDNQRAWRCPVCGHVEVLDIQEYKNNHCNIFGNKL